MDTSASLIPRRDFTNYFVFIIISLCSTIFFAFYELYLLFIISFYILAAETIITRMATWFGCL